MQKKVYAWHHMYIPTHAYTDISVHIHTHIQTYVHAQAGTQAQTIHSCAHAWCIW